MKVSSPTLTFSSLLQRFFCERLIDQQNVSERTVAAYRDTFRLLLHYLKENHNITPSAVVMADMNAEMVSSFLTHLEHHRGNSIRTRNARLAALRSFLKYASALDPASLGTIQRVLAIPMKRFQRPVLGFLSREEISAVLDAPDTLTWSGRRDRVLLNLLYNTGARVSEIVSLNVCDVRLDTAAPAVTIHGKGRKDRCVPLWNKTAKALRVWLRQIPQPDDGPLFPAARGRRLSRSGVRQRLELAVDTARNQCPSLSTKNVSPHTIRHTTAMHLLQSGVDMSVIALWLGHESLATTHMYIEADLTMKEQALGSLAEPGGSVARYHPPEKLIQFLDEL